MLQNGIVGKTDNKNWGGGRLKVTNRGEGEDEDTHGRSISGNVEM